MFYVDFPIRVLNNWALYNSNSCLISLKLLELKACAEKDNTVFRSGSTRILNCLNLPRNNLEGEIWTLNSTMQSLTLDDFSLKNLFGFVLVIGQFSHFNSRSIFSRVEENDAEQSTNEIEYAA